MCWSPGKTRGSPHSRQRTTALRITPPREAPLEGVVAVVVSNNPYGFARWDRLGQCHRLDMGMLQVSVLDANVLEELERLVGGTTHLGTTAAVRPSYASGRLSAWRWAPLARGCRPG